MGHIGDIEPEPNVLIHRDAPRTAPEETRGNPGASGLVGRPLSARTMIGGLG